MIIIIFINNIGVLNFNSRCFESLVVVILMDSFYLCSLVPFLEADTDHDTEQNHDQATQNCYYNNVQLFHSNFLGWHNVRFPGYGYVYVCIFLLFNSSNFFHQRKQKNIWMYSFDLNWLTVIILIDNLIITKLLSKRKSSTQLTDLPDLPPTLLLLRSSGWWWSHRRRCSSSSWCCSWRVFSFSDYETERWSHSVAYIGVQWKVGTRKSFTEAFTIQYIQYNFLNISSKGSWITS